MTMRLSTRSLAGTARTLVAVGTVSEASMLVTTRALAPRIGVVSGWLTAPLGLGAAGLARLRRVGRGGGRASSALASPGRCGLGRRGLPSRGAGALAGRRPGRSRLGRGSALAAAAFGASALGAVGRRRRRACGGAGRRGGGGRLRPPRCRRRRRRRCRHRGARPPGRSPRRSPTTPCRPSSCPSGTARTARPPATRWVRRRSGGRWKRAGRARRIRLFLRVDIDVHVSDQPIPPPLAEVGPQRESRGTTRRAGMPRGRTRHTGRSS